MIRQIETQHKLYESVEAMLSPETLSNSLGRTVSQITREEFNQDVGASDSRFERVMVDHQTFILKHMPVLADWISIRANDTLCRTVRLWQYGVLDKLHPTIDHGIISACLDQDEYVVLMRDVTDYLVDFNRPLAITDAKKLLDALVTIHVAFWNNDDLRQPELGLSDTKTTVETFWPEEYRDMLKPVKLFRRDEDWWSYLFDYVEPDVRDIMQSIMNNPESLYSKLAEFPSTLIHGDFKLANLAIQAETNQVVALDWQLSGYSTPTIDLHWFLTGFVPETSFNGLEYYHRQLSMRLGEQWNQELWQPMLEVGYLAAVLRFGWIHGWNGSNSPTRAFAKYLPEFNDIVRNGAKWL